MVPEVIKAVMLDLEHPLPSLSKRHAAIPREIVKIVDKCLAKRKEHRYQSATALLADLQAFLAPRSRASAPGEVSPYRGLVAYNENDAQYFFGRSSEIRTAL